MATKTIANSRPKDVADDKTIAEILQTYVRAEEAGLRIDATLPYDEWAQVYDFYLSLRERSKFFVGDAINFGAQRHGDRYTQAVHATGLEYSSLVNIASVCERIPIERRRPNLPFSFHEAVAFIPAQEADRILADAEKKHYTREDVRDQVAISQGKPTKAQRDAAKTGRTTKAKVTARGANEPAIIDVQATVTKGGDEPCAPTKEPLAQQQPTFTSQDAAAKSVSASNAAQPSNPAAAAKPLVLGSAAINEALAPERAEDALTIAEARLHQFVAAIPAMKAGELKPLQRRRWLTMLIPIDELIDVLQKP